MALTLAGVHPVGQRLFLDANQLGREHQRREAHDRHVGDDAVVVGRIALGDGQRFAAALRRADVVVEARPLAVQPLDEHHRGVVRLLHLHVAEVGDRLVVERPVVRGGVVARRGGWPRRAAPPRRGRTAAAGAEAGLVSRIAAVGDEAARQERRRARAGTPGQVGDGAVHAAAAQLDRAAGPASPAARREVDRPRRRAGVDRIDDPVHAAIRRGVGRLGVPLRPASVTRRTGSPILSTGIAAPRRAAVQSAAAMTLASLRPGAAAGACAPRTGPPMAEAVPHTAVTSKSRTARRDVVRSHGRTPDVSNESTHWLSSASGEAGVRTSAAQPMSRLVRPRQVGVRDLRAASRSSVLLFTARYAARFRPSAGRCALRKPPRLLPA